MDEGVNNGTNRIVLRLCALSRYSANFVLTYEDPSETASPANDGVPAISIEQGSQLSV